MKPEISIVIPFFNSEKTLVRAISSVLSQSFHDWELILVNDGSVDSSEEVAKSFFFDSRISYLFQKNRGVSAARNLGAERAKGEWLIFLDSDDELDNSSLYNFRMAILSDLSKDCWMGGIKRVVDDQITTLLPKEGEYFSKIPGTFCLRTTLFEQIDGYDETMRFSENTELFHRLGLVNLKIGIISAITLTYFDSPYGGSKNRSNITGSLSYFLKKHNDSLSNHVKFLFNEILGVNFLREGEFKQASVHFKEGLRLKPTNIKAWSRLVLSYASSVSKIIYRNG